MEVLIIGLGSIAQKHIKAIKSLEPFSKLYALRSSQDALSMEGIHNIYKYSEIIEINPDFIIISNPTSEHFQTLNLLAELNIPLFIEKPLFASLSQEALRLVKKINANNIPTYVACNLRFLECLIEIKNIVQNIRINEVNVYCGSYLPNWRPNIDFRKIYSANKEMGGGVHIDLIHELDYIYWLFGAPLSSSTFFSKKSSLAISAFDYANYLWNYPEFIANIVLNYYRRDSKRTLELVSDEGTYLVNLLKNSIHKDGELIFENKQTIQDTYLAQMNFFLNKILKKNEKFNPINEAYAILELCLKD